MRPAACDKRTVLDNLEPWEGEKGDATKWGKSTGNVDGTNRGQMGLCIGAGNTIASYRRDIDMVLRVVVLVRGVFAY